MSNDALLKVIGIIGSRKVLAAKLCVSVDRITAWLNKEISIPLEYARLMELLTNGAIKREELAPERMQRIPKEWKNQLFNSTQPSITQTHLSDNQVSIGSLSISEKVRQGMIVEVQIKRQGKRNDLNKQLRQNFDEVKGRADEFVAKKLMFGNRTSYQQAKQVVQKGCVELIEAMDNGLVVISVAAIIASLPFDEQRKILKKNKKEIRDFIKRLSMVKK